MHQEISTYISSLLACKENFILLVLTHRRFVISLSLFIHKLAQIYGILELDTCREWFEELDPKGAGFRKLHCLPLSESRETKRGKIKESGCSEHLSLRTSNPRPNPRGSLKKSNGFLCESWKRNASMPEKVLWRTQSSWQRKRERRWRQRGEVVHARVTIKQ